MAFSTTSFHFPRSWTQVIQFLSLIWQISCLTLSSHLYLGLPCDILVRGFHLNIFLTVLVSGILCTWPNQLSLWALIWMTIFLCFISLSSSSLVLILHIWFSFVGPNILLKIFFSKTSNFWIMVSFSTHVSEAYAFDYSTSKYTSSCYFVWVKNLVFHSKERTQNGTVV